MYKPHASPRLCAKNSVQVVLIWLVWFFVLSVGMTQTQASKIVHTFFMYFEWCGLLIRMYKIVWETRERKNTYNEKAPNCIQRLTAEKPQSFNFPLKCENMNSSWKRMANFLTQQIQNPVWQTHECHLDTPRQRLGINVQMPFTFNSVLRSMKRMRSQMKASDCKQKAIMFSNFHSGVLFYKSVSDCLMHNRAFIVILLCVTCVRWIRICRIVMIGWSWTVRELSSKLVCCWLI